MKVKLAFWMGKLRVKWLKTGAFLRHIPVLLTIGSASPGMQRLLICGLAGDASVSLHAYYAL